MKSGNAAKRTRIRAESRKRSKERSRSLPPVGISIAHKSDQNMYVKTQEVVKAWIKECSEKKVVAVKEIMAKPDIPKTEEWIVVGAKSKGKEKVKVSNIRDFPVGKVFGKPGFAESLSLFPGMRSVKKLAKLEAKKYFVKNTIKGPSRPRSTGIDGLKVSDNISLDQDNRGSSSVKPDNL